MKKILIALLLGTLCQAETCYDLKNEVSRLIDRANSDFGRYRDLDACEALNKAEYYNRIIIRQCRLLDGTDQDVRRYISYLKRTFGCR